MNENSTHSLNTFSSTWTGKTKHMSKLFWKSVVRLIPKVKPNKMSSTNPENEHPYSKNAPLVTDFRQSNRPQELGIK